MKKLLTLLFFIASICQTYAYEINLTRMPDYALSVKAHLIIDREKRSLGIEFRNKLIDRNISIEPHVIRGAIDTRYQTIENIVISPKTRSDGSTGIHIA